jgi:predicted porin
MLDFKNTKLNHLANKHRIVNNFFSFIERMVYYAFFSERSPKRALYISPQFAGFSFRLNPLLIRQFRNTKTIKQNVFMDALEYSTM